LAINPPDDNGKSVASYASFSLGPGGFSLAQRNGQRVDFFKPADFQFVRLKTTQKEGWQGQLQR